MKTKSSMNIAIEGYEEKAQCVNCEETTECVVLKTRDYTAPHCPKCLLKEVKKRAKPREVDGD